MNVAVVHIRQGDLRKELIFGSGKENIVELEVVRRYFIFLKRRVSLLAKLPMLTTTELAVALKK